MRSNAPKSVSVAKNRSPKKGGMLAHESFPLVAVGASAGGLEAYTEFFRALPVDTGMAFVLVQHLDPTHPSMLAQIIGKTTKLPVEEVESGARIRPDCIYVIPPNTLMCIAGEFLKLIPRTKRAGLNLPINFFMRSLAQERKSKAIGIVLSGTGTDGTLGLEDIKAEGGITFAQEPTTAKYDGMPRAAVDSGCVDFVLPVKEIVKELRRITRHPYVQLDESAEEEAGREAIDVGPLRASSDDFSGVLGHLRKATGVDFSQYKPNTIQRRALRRMMILKLETLGEYAKHLKENPAESLRLYDDVLIPVTSFFRDLEAFEALKLKVYPAIVKEKSNKGMIRMWAPGCSTGEETYSLAMTLLEFLGDRASSYHVQIFGTDLNDKGIQRARTGVYRESIANEISAERMQRFFVKTEGGYRINKAVRDMCIFARQNLANDPPFSQMNLVACRNLLIYIQPTLQKKIIPILHYALKSTGFLLLGSSESVSGFPTLFSTIDKKHKIYAKKAVASRLHYDFVQSYYPATMAPVIPGKPAKMQDAPSSESDVLAAADRLVLKNHAPVGVIINSALEIIQFRGRTIPYLEQTQGKPSLNVLKLARDGLGIELRRLINAAMKKGAHVRQDGVRFDAHNHKRILNLTVTPLGERDRKGSKEKQFFLVLFEDVTALWTQPGNVSPETKGTAKDKLASTRLKREIAGLQDALRIAVESEDSLKEEFQSANEEILSANEELQSTNEELETSKEELQSANEEMSTLNAELQNKNGELNNSNNDLLNFLNSTKIPVVMLDRGLKIRRITPTAEKMLKVVPSDIGRSVSDLRSNIEALDLESMIGTVLETLQPEERDVKDRDGHWFSLSILPYQTQDNKIDGVVLSLHDIDAIKSANALLVKSTEFFRGIIDTVREPLLVLDHDFEVVAANEAFLHTFKVTSEETVSKLLYDLGNKQWNSRGLRTMLEQVLPRDQVVTDFMVEHDFEGIGQKKMLLNARILEQSEKRQPMILLAIEDITEQKLAEEKALEMTRLLEQQSHIHETTLSSISDFTYTIDRQGRFLYANRPLLNLLGLRLEEVVGKSFFDLKYPEELAARHQKEIQQVFATGKKISGESTYTSAKGVIGYYEYIFNPVFCPDGTVELIAGSTRDVSGRKRAEATLIKSEKLAAAGRLAATLAHEINNPLQAVTNLMAILSQSPGLDAQEKSFAKMAEEELGRVVQLTQQSLGFYRESIFPSEVNLEEVLDGVLSLYAKQLANKDIQVSKRYRSGAFTIHSYPGEIRQIFSTLLVNAMEAVNTGGTIVIRLRASTRLGKPEVSGIRITICDNGVGIPPGNLASVFEPFFTTKGEHGTGLGLWVANGIVNRLGGSIRMRSSVTPGRSGTYFSIFLPERVESRI